MDEVDKPKRRVRTKQIIESDDEEDDSMSSPSAEPERTQTTGINDDSEED